MRSLGDRYATYADEVGRFLRAGAEVMRRTQSINPKVSDVVREAGLSNQAFYRHFKGKDELLVAILDDGADQLVHYLTHLMDKETRPSDKVRRWVTGIMAQAVDPVAADVTRPFVVDSLRLAAQHPEESMRSEERLRGPLRAALEAASLSGELPGADPIRDSEAVYYLTMGTMQGYLVRDEVPTAEAVTRLCDFVIAGLAGTQATAATKTGVKAGIKAGTKERTGGRRGA